MAKRFGGGLLGDGFKSGFEFDLGLDFDFDLDLDLDFASDSGGEWLEGAAGDDGFHWYGEARARTWKAVNLDLYDAARVAGRYDMPALSPYTGKPPKTLIDFNAMLASQTPADGVHFFIDDYRFERVWRLPLKYAEAVAAKSSGIVLTPDFSLYLDMPEAMKVWNVYRSRLIGQIFQDFGLDVIPTLQWAEPKSYDYCFDGVPEGATVAVSTVGVMMSEDARAIWRHGMNAALERLKPTTVLVYGAKMPGFEFPDCVKVKSYSARKWAKKGD